MQLDAPTDGWISDQARLPIAVLNIGSTKEDEAAFQFLSINKESHRHPPSVQYLCRLIG